VEVIVRKDFKLSYGRWILKKLSKKTPYLKLGRWVLKIKSKGE